MKINNLIINEEASRDIYLKKLALGKIQGPLTGRASIDKPWLKFYSDEEITQDLPEMNMIDFMYKCNKNNLDNTALSYYGTKISYEKLFLEIEKAAKGLSQLGIKKGDYVTIGMPFLPETIYSIYALNKIGAVANIIDPRVPAEKFKKYMIGCNSKYLITLNACYSKVQEFKDEIDLCQTIYVSPTNSLPYGLQFAKSIKDFLSKINNHNTEIKLDNDSINWNTLVNIGTKNDKEIKSDYETNMPAAIIYTSGTSGEPKGAISSNESMNNITLGQIAALKNTVPGDKFLLIMPPFIAYGLAIGMHGQLCKGQTLIMEPTFNIDNSKELLGNLVKKYKPQTIMGVPTFMVDLKEHPAMQHLDCSFLKNAIVGGDSMVPAAEKQVDKFFASKNSTALVRKGWGLTEVQSAATYTKDDIDNPIGSVGIPLLGNNIKIVKPLREDITDIDVDNLDELAYEQEGEIFINSRSAILDYLNNPEESKKVFFISKKTGEKWIRTKDLGKITSDGNLYILGRMKRIIIRPDGHNISPFAIENIINSIPMVENCAVVAHKSEQHEHGSFAVAYIQIKTGYESLLDSVLEMIIKKTSENLPPRDTASYYEFVDELPLTNIGKVDYKELEKREKVKVRIKEKITKK